MNGQETLRNLQEYWTSLEFDHIKTYSGLRRDSYLKLARKGHAQIKEYKAQKVKSRKKQVIELDRKIAALEDDIYGSVLYPREDQVGLHKSTIQITNLKKGESLLEPLDRIFSTPVVNQSFWMCAPVYRDAIVVYSSDETIVGGLQICFGCDHILNFQNEIMEVDDSVFPMLKGLMIRWGHAIQESENMLWNVSFL